ncbi:MAG: 2-hydroxyglutaryl-CoA dehydratase [Planctomycetes bacterium]|jgi:predicted CoA-substrate-specific enzyme activase|nr:2-hydroxyglutaryl-CoA dehydratase [Planctomycetota bacterium]MDP6520394.1 acyl-CoA dehydratase activase [Planctomycetota bacterium]
MTITAGIDVGSTYIKAVLLAENGDIVGTSLRPSGFKLGATAELAFDEALKAAGLTRNDIAYTVATGIGRHQVAFKDIHVTDLTASARGAARLFPGTRTVLDVGGQTMKATKTDEAAKVVSFRLNDKCAAGTGAFLEKTARYMGYSTVEIGPLMSTSKEPVPISGVCAVFAESEVINHLSLGTPPADIMQGAIESLTQRCVQLIKRVKAQPEYTLIGGILRFATMAKAVEEQLGAPVNVPAEEHVQHVGALGCAILGHRRLEILREKEKATSVA